MMDFTAGGSNLNLSVFSFSVSTPTIGYSVDSEWILDKNATFHVSPSRDWFSTFEKLDSCSIVMSDDHSCNMKKISTILVKILTGWYRN